MKGKYGSSIQGSLDKCMSRDSPIIKGNYLLDPLTSGGSNNPFTLGSEYATVAVVKVCGFAFGRFCSNPDVTRNYSIGDVNYGGNHAEDFFLSAWEEAWDTPVMKQMRVARALEGKALHVTIKLTKSPCHLCAEKLRRFMEHYHVRLRMKVLRLYEGDPGATVNAYALLMLASNGAAVKMWDVLDPKKGYRKQTKVGQSHEQKYMTRHLKELALQNFVDEDMLGEAKEKTAIERISEEFRGLVEEMQVKTLKQLSARLGEFREKKTMLDTQSTPKDFEKLKKLQEKSEIQKGFLENSNLSYLQVVADVKDVLGVEPYREAKDDDFQASELEAALELYLGDEYEELLPSVRWSGW